MYLRKREKDLLNYFETKLVGSLSHTTRLPKPFVHEDASRLIKEGIIHFENGMYSLSAAYKAGEIVIELGYVSRAVIRDELTKEKAIAFFKGKYDDSWWEVPNKELHTWRRNGIILFKQKAMTIFLDGDSGKKNRKEGYTFEYSKIKFIVQGGYLYIIDKHRNRVKSDEDFCIKY